MDYNSDLLSNLDWPGTTFLIHDLKTWVGMFKNMVGSIPGGNLLSGNFPSGNLPGRSLMGGSFPGGNFPDTLSYKLYLDSHTTDCLDTPILNHVMFVNLT